jgi:NAD(P)-dependent dehydrogenase (short-subunit alcohol dehydrogenase family)
MKFAVKNKVALVTGANRGIGKAIVESLIKHGVKKVYAAARKPDSIAPLVEQHGDRVIPLQIDMNKPDTITAAAESAGDVELVVNNAGILENASPLSENAIQALENEFNVNVFGLLRMAQAFAPVLKKNGGGAFVQLNSVASIKCFADFATYSASKAAAYSLTQGLRDKLGEQGTLVLSVHPGPIDTDMAAKAGLKDMAQPVTLVSEGIIRALEAGDFHLFPDDMAQSIWGKYEGFSRNVIEANLLEE